MILSKKNTIIILLLFATTIIGLYSKFYTGSFHIWINNSLGGVFYEIFWCLLAYLLFNNILRITVSVFLITCTLEFLQLWHPLFLEYIRSYFIGRTLLGTSFVWSDFIYYFIGCVISYLILKKIQKV